ncbi:MAG TPA: MFS transporter [Steroidobacter sp.]|uniref:MFS transporter n=1 Tax=Steroidobacter sp. TaxID=1978227 RepID=UPI002EDB9FD9
MAAPSGVKSIGQDGPLTLWQMIVVGLCILANVCDGLDTTSIAFAAPSLLRDWNIAPEAFGVVLSAAAVGMLIGAILIAPLADKVGRRTVIVAALTTSSICMFGLAFSQNLYQLMIFRFFVGMCVGALLPSLSIMVVEFSNEKRGNLFLALVHIGFALGAILGAAVGASLVQEYGWRAIFLTAAILTSVTAISCFAALPESVNFLLARQPANALERANKILGRFGLARLTELPPKPPAKVRRFSNVVAILSPDLLRATLLLWLASFSRFFISYFLTGWKPQVLVMAGFTDRNAIAVGMATSAAASVGVLCMGLFAAKIGASRATGLMFFICAAALLGFGFTEAPIPLVVLAAVCMFTIEAAFTGILITSTRFYSVENRSTGVGFTVGIGRIGAIVGPYVGGALIGMGLDRSSYFPVYASAAIIGAIAIVASMSRRPPEAREGQPVSAH